MTEDDKITALLTAAGLAAAGGIATVLAVLVRREVAYVRETERLQSQPPTGGTRQWTDRNRWDRD